MLHRSDVLFLLGFSSILCASAPAFAEGPRPITASEAGIATCFGFAADGAMYAVRKKESCDSTTLKCESSTYLSRVVSGGFGKTVGYLTRAKADGGLPSEGAIGASVHSKSLEAANAAMADATGPCSEALPGAKLTLEGGRTVKVIREPGGRTVLRGDNFREVVIASAHEQIFWGPGAKRWFARRTIGTEDVAAAGLSLPPSTDTEFFSFDASRLFGPMPSPASDKATALTRANLLMNACLGVERSTGTYYFNSSTVEQTRVVFRLHAVSPLGIATHLISTRQRLAAAPNPINSANAVSDGELAFANERLAKVDAACTLSMPIAGLPPVEIPAGLEGEQPIMAGISSDSSGGKVLRFSGKLGARRKLWIQGTVAIYSALGASHVVVQTMGASTTFQSFPMTGLALEPRRFPMPASLERPVCLHMPEPRIMDVERYNGKAAIVLRSIQESVHVIVEGPEGTNAAELLAAVTDEMKVDLAERFSVSDSKCEVVSFEGLDRSKYEGLKHERFAGLGVAELKGEWHLETTAQTLKLKAKGKPSWVMFSGWGGRPFWGVDDMNSRITFEEDNPFRWVDRPEDPEVAKKAPKQLMAKTPSFEPHDRRCLAWDGKTLTAWIVRWQSTCPDAGEENAFDCPEEALLTEVRKDGYFKRATLHRDGSDWTHMYEHANAFTSKSDLGCLAGLEATIKGRTFVVGQVDDHVTVTVGSTTKKVGKVIDELSRVAVITTAYWHPDVEALVIELDAGMATRYIWVDTSKIK